MRCTFFVSSLIRAIIIESVRAPPWWVPPPYPKIATLYMWGVGVMVTVGVILGFSMSEFLTMLEAFKRLATTMPANTMQIVQNTAINTILVFLVFTTVG